MLLWVGVLLLVVGGRRRRARRLPRRGPDRSRRSLELSTTGRHARPWPRTSSCEDRLLDPLLNALRGLAVRLSPAGTSERIAHSLDKAGNPPSWSVGARHGFQGHRAGFGVVLSLLVFGLGLTGLLVSLAFGAFGFFLPDLLVYNAGLRRQKEMRRGLADALDMLTVCGGRPGLRCRHPPGGSHGDRSHRWRVRPRPVGDPDRQEPCRRVCLTRGAHHCPRGEDVRERLVQADRMGLPIAAVLREQTKEMRIARRQRAEEQAQKVTVKILFPLLLCIFPALFIIIIGPGAIRIVELFRVI